LPFGTEAGDQFVLVLQLPSVSPVQKLCPCAAGAQKKAATPVNRSTAILIVVRAIHALLGDKIPPPLCGTAEPLALRRGDRHGGLPDDG
jgi:hypothetical protein